MKTKEVVCGSLEGICHRKEVSQKEAEESLKGEEEELERNL